MHPGIAAGVLVLFGIVFRVAGHYQDSQRRRFESSAHEQWPTSVKDKISYYKWTGTGQSSRVWKTFGTAALTLGLLLGVVAVIRA
jgi:hypothetical protein